MRILRTSSWSSVVSTKRMRIKGSMLKTAAAQVTSTVNMPKSFADMP